MEYTIIRNSRDLKSEIYRLEEESKQKGEALKAHFSSPAAVFSTLFSLIRKPSTSDDEKSGGVFSQDFVSLISRFLIPLALNKTIFRNSNFLVKALVGLVSQKASGYISEDSVGNVWHKLKTVIDEHSVGILGKVKSLFGSKKGKRAGNYPANTPIQRNYIKSDINA